MPSTQANTRSRLKRKSAKSSGPMKSLLGKKGYNPIENYGVIGDLHSVALVGMDGSIDWCCLPHFDSPSIFASILDAQKGGYFKIAPLQCTVEKQMYLPGTCVLVTRFLSPDGVGEIIDFMPIQKDGGSDKRFHQIIRRVRVVRGRVRFKIECNPAFNYARSKHTVKIRPHGAVFTSGKEHVGLSASVKLKTAGKAVEGEFVLRSGGETTFIFRRVEEKFSKYVLDPGFDYEQVFEDTCEYWRRWVSKSTYRGRWREMVERSAMTLKLLTFDPTGAIVAAPTTSLPEEVGGVRNWDYRYTWVRDAAFTVYAFLRMGFTQEAEKFMKWIDARAREEGSDGSLQIMYSIHGEHKLTETTLKHLEGYRGSAPVRVGNAAYNQLQLDIYGELMDSVYLSNKYGKPISYELWTHLRRLLGYVCRHWKDKDEGIWEVRGGRNHFVYSKLMCWVALDRGIRLADKRSFPSNRILWRKTRDQIFEEIMKKGWNKKKKCFVQTYGSDALDASNLMMPLVFFISPTDPRMLSTLDATMEHLVSDSLVYRYQVGKGASDGLAGEEGTFSMCTFWLVECLSRAGRLREARLIFEKMLSYANHLGLYAEQVGASGESLGNFPQAFTHMGLISAAYNLDRRLGASD